MVTCDLQSRLIQTYFTTMSDSGTIYYKYDPSGQRYQQQVVNWSPIQNTVTTTYLADSANPTGYPQTLEEYAATKTVISGVETVTTTVTTYTLGLDVIAQSDANGVLYMAYDGHGSTRALLDADGQVAVKVVGSAEFPQRFAYDAYGNMLAGTGLISDAASALTVLLYSGEQTDAASRLQYLRARYMDPSIGRFISYDSYEGSTSDPMSLHKYLYANANPIYYSDPSGNMSLPEFLCVGAKAVGRLALAAATWARVHPVLTTLFATLAGYRLYMSYGLQTNVLTEPYVGYIRAAAQRWRLKPELVATIIAQEQADLDYKDVFDVPAAKLGRDSSIGLGQIRISTAIKYNLVGTADRDAVIARLRDPEKNIDAAAHYIRIVADMAGPAGAAVGATRFKKVDLALYSQDGTQWDYSNGSTIRLIASEYTSPPWDFTRSTNSEIDLGYHTTWGDKALKIFRDIERMGVFK